MVNEIIKYPFYFSFDNLDYWSIVQSYKRRYRVGNSPHIETLICDCVEVQCEEYFVDIPVEYVYVEQVFMKDTEMEGTFRLYSTPMNVFYVELVVDKTDMNLFKLKCPDKYMRLVNFIKENSNTYWRYHTE